MDIFCLWNFTNMWNVILEPCISSLQFMTLHVKHYIENETLIKISHCRGWWRVWRQRTISWKQEVLHHPLSFLAAHLLLPPPSHQVWPASWTPTKPNHPWASQSPSASASMSAPTLVSSCRHDIWYLNIKTCWLQALHPITNLADWVKYFLCVKQTLLLWSCWACHLRGMRSLHVWWSV